MKRISGKKVEDCFDGGLRFEYQFDGAIAERFMRRIAEGARLDFYPDFPLPFFKIFLDSGLQIKGVLGGREIEAYFPKERRDALQAWLEAELDRIGSLPD